jgi:hypothetical protein
MSVYRVINNYYNDLLNFLSEEDSINKGLINMFRDITPDKKKIIITKLAEMMIKFDMAFANEINYWNSNKKDQTWFLIIYILMLLITFIITIFFFIFSLKELTALNAPFMKKIKLSLTHLIVYQVIFAIFLVLIINIRATQKLCTGQVALLKEDLKYYTNYIFIGAHRDNMAKFFTFVGYWRRNSKSRYNNIYKELKNDSSYDNVLSLFNITNSKTSASEDPSLKINPGTEIQIYDALKLDIESSLIKFYNFGNGYIDIKKLVILSSPILMLKEARRIMDYYYFIGIKKFNADDISNHDDKIKVLIDQIVISPINNLIKDFNTSNTEISDSELSAMVILNDNDNNFKNAMEKLIQAFDYLAIFAYPIYLKISDQDKSFPLPEILQYMPNKINIENKDKENKDFLNGVKTAFSKVYDNDYQNYINNSKNIDNVDALYTELFMKFIPLFTELYYSVFLFLQGGHWFPFNHKFIINKIQQSLATGMTTSLPLEFRTNISQLMFDTIITKIGSNFDIITIKRGYLVENISNSLTQTNNINLLKYQNFIVNTLMKKNEAAKKYNDEIIELINQIDKSVIQKKQLKSGIEINNDNKYIEPEDFIDSLKTIQYNEFIKGLNVPFYKDVVDKFYINISESVNLKRADMRNIYYTRQKNFNVWKLAIIMVIISLILILIRFIIEVSEQKKNIKYVAPLRQCDIVFAERDYKNRTTNWWIKLVLPVFILLFVITLLISYYKKMKSIYEFNLEIIETNTNELKNLLSDFDSKLIEIDTKLDIVEKSKTIQLITKITSDDKKDLLDYIKRIIDKFDKCNYILESAKNQLPFPYTEVIINGFFMSASIICIFYVWFNYAPIKRLKDNKYLYMLKEELLIVEDLNIFDKKLNSLGTCHGEDMDAIVFSLKLIFFMFITMFLVFYSIKIITSANDFKMGLFNSSYYEESKCY